ncbi:MAG: hypothetical protein ACR2HY_04800 [Acidimicrobiales bacterium]
MSSGIRFRLFGIPVTIDPSFFLIAALLGFGGGSLAFVVTWVVVVFVSVLAHELGHAVAFRVYGQQPQVLLQGMGGLTSGSAPLPFGRDIVVSLAGPLTGLVLLGLPALWLQSGSGSLSLTRDMVLRAVVFVNIAWSGVNLLPVLPLDGGQVAASLLQRFKGHDGVQAARVVSMVVAAAAGAYALRLNYVFGALFAGFFVVQNYTDWRKVQTVASQEPLVAGYQALLANDFDTAMSEADRVLATAPAPEVAAGAVELKAWARLCSEGAAAASAELADMPPGVMVNTFLAGCLALDAGRTDEALDHFADGFRRSQSGSAGGPRSASRAGGPRSASRAGGPWSLIVAEAVARHGMVGELAERLVATPGAGVEALERLQSHLHAAGRLPEAALVAQRAAAAGGSAPPPL